MTGWYDRHLQRYFDFIRPGAPDCLDRVFTRGLAFVVLSLDCMVRATGERRYRENMATGIGMILAMQSGENRGRNVFELTFGDTWAGRTPFLDNHAACILAVARAAWHGDPDGKLGRAAHDGIVGICLYSGTVDLGGGHTEAYDGLAVLNKNGTHADTGFWNFKVAMVLRALAAVQCAAEAGVIAMSEQERERLLLRRQIARDLVAGSMRWHGDMLEVLTSRIAGETNSETQPWVALGLVPAIDERIVKLGHGAR